MTTPFDPSSPVTHNPAEDARTRPEPDRFCHVCGHDVEKHVGIVGCMARFCGGMCQCKETPESIGDKAVFMHPTPPQPQGDVCGGVWFESACSGLRYRERKAAGTVSAIIVDHERFVIVRDESDMDFTPDVEAQHPQGVEVGEVARRCAVEICGVNDPVRLPTLEQTISIIATALTAALASEREKIEHMRGERDASAALVTKFQAEHARALHAREQAEARLAEISGMTDDDCRGVTSALVEAMGGSDADEIINRDLMESELSSLREERDALRLAVDEAREYAQHKRGCIALMSVKNGLGLVIPKCTCGIDAWLARNGGKGGG